MNPAKRFITLALFATFAAIAAYVPRSLSAQEVPTAFANEGVIGSGAATVDLDPQFLRIQVPLSVEAKDAKLALAALKQAQQSAVQKLAKFGAAESAIKFNDLQVNDGSRAQQMQRQMGMRFGQTQSKKPQQQPVVTASSTLVVDIPLKNKPGEELVLEFQEIRRLVKAANLNDAKATPEQQEEAEEQQAMAAQMMAEGGSPNEPSFLFVAKVADADRDKALAEAFTQARKEAERLAKAAGLSLVGVKLLVAANGPDITDRLNNFNAYAYRQAMAARAGMPAAADAEGFNDQPVKVTYRARVHVAYTVKPQ